MNDAFYHVDRRDALAAGETITLEGVDEWDPAADLDEWTPDVEEHLEDMYPGGLSNHGRYYCRQDLYEEDGDGLWDVSCELVFELVRVARFPERPSRFQSVFGFRALQDAERFVEEYVDSPCTIWRVTADGSFTADMRLVDAETYAHGVSQANDYWRGSTYVDEPLWEVLLVPPVDVVELVEEEPSA